MGPGLASGWCWTENTGLPSTRMPAYPESALNDADARDIYAYIQTFELNAPDVEDIPALQVILESAGKPLAE